MKQVGKKTKHSGETSLIIGGAKWGLNREFLECRMQMRKHKRATQQVMP